MTPFGDLARMLEGSGIEVHGWLLAWAKVAPVVVLVPAFGLRALPIPTRAVVALVLGAILVPAIHPAPVATMPFGAQLAIQLAQGLPVALAAAVPLWAATMAGGVVDTLRGAQDTLDLPVIEERVGSLGVLFSLLAGALFFRTGGASRVLGALLTTAPVTREPLVRAAADLAAGINLAVTIAAPLVAAAVLLDVAGALFARAASPARAQTGIAAVRSLALIAMTGLLLDRIARLLALCVVADAG